MDIAALKSYVCLLKEIELDGKRIDSLRKELDTMTPMAGAVSDVVTHGKRGKKPLKTSVIHGLTDSTKINRKRARLQMRILMMRQHQAEQKKRVAAVERFIDSLDDDQFRLIVKLRCMGRADRLRTWEEVAAEMGEGYSAESVRKYYSRKVSHLSH